MKKENSSDVDATCGPHRPSRSDLSLFAIEKVFEKEFGIFATGFAASDYALHLVKSCGVDDNDVLFMSRAPVSVLAATLPFLVVT